MNQYLTNACGGCGSKKKKKGFTLIELLIVITIIGILAVALLPRIIGAPARARDVARKADLAELSTALEAFMSDTGAYPVSVGGKCLADNDADLSSYFDNNKVPTDPLTTNAYAVGGSTTLCTTSGANAGTYYYQSLTRNGVPGSAYLLLAKLELPCTGGTPGCADASKVSTGGVTEVTVDAMNTAIFLNTITAGSEAYALVK